jgi:hypothetical protein
MLNINLCKVHIWPKYSTLGKLPHTHKIVIAGNHELTFDPDLVASLRVGEDIGVCFTSREMDAYLTSRGVKATQELLTNCIYLLDSAVDLCGIIIYGAPW